VKHLRLANGRGPGGGPTAGRSKRDLCLVDYSGCAVSDTCWLLDFESDCVSHDGCIVDTT
jgi:hypothetical protein